MKKTLALSLFIMAVSSVVFAQEYRVNRTYESKRTKLKSADLGKNIIAFSPLTFAVNTSYAYESNPFVAVGFSYERIFNNEYISFKLPVNFTIGQPGIFLLPTIKLYPKKQGIVKYAVGPQFLISYVEDYMPSYLSIYPSQGYYDTRRQFGFALNNSLNFTISKNLYVGMDAGLGILYYDSFNDQANKNYNNNYNNGAFDMNLNNSFNFGFSMGCRF